MRENKITIIIKRPVEEVFEFTTNPKNTHLWIHSIQEEVSDEIPSKIGTQYKNHSANSDWCFYKVVEYESFKIFTLSDLEENYHARYTYHKLNNYLTKMKYFEWMENGKLMNPFTQNILDNLKSIMEK